MAVPASAGKETISFVDGEVILYDVDVVGKRCTAFVIINQGPDKILFRCDPLHREGDFAGLTLGRQAIFRAEVITKVIVKNILSGDSSVVSFGILEA